MAIESKQLFTLAVSALVICLVMSFALTSAVFISGCTETTDKKGDIKGYTLLYDIERSTNIIEEEKEIIYERKDSSYLLPLRFVVDITLPLNATAKEYVGSYWEEEGKTILIKGNNCWVFGEGNLIVWTSGNKVLNVHYWAHSAESPKNIVVYNEQKILEYYLNEYPSDMEYR